MTDRFSIHGRVVIVTGASRGIGRALATGFAEAGAAVVCAARTLDACDEVAAEIRDGGGDAIAVRFDIADRDAMQGDDTGEDRAEATHTAAFSSASR